MNKFVLGFYLFMMAIGLSTGLYAVVFRQAIDLIAFRIPWALAGLVYLGGTLFLAILLWEERG